MKGGLGFRSFIAAATLTTSASTSWCPVRPRWILSSAGMSPSQEHQAKQVAWKASRWRAYHKLIFSPSYWSIRRS